MRSTTMLLTLCLACGGDDGEPAADGSTTGSGDSTGSTSAAGSTAEPTTSNDATGGPTGDDTTSGSTGGEALGSPGCGLEIPTGLGAVEIEIAGASREYLVSIPDDYDPDAPLPLIFAYHGRGGTAELARSYFQVEQSTDGQAIVVYPQGLPLASMGGLTGWDLTSAGVDVQMFDAVLEQMSEGACIDLARVFATGHSFGGYMSNGLGCFRPGALRAIAPVAGGPPLGSCEPESVAAWITHGTLDEVVPFSQGEFSRDALLERNGCAATSVPVEPAPCVTYDACDDGLPVVWCPHDETNLQGHMWPRFAGSAIWEFFDSLPAEG